MQPIFPKTGTFYRYRPIPLARTARERFLMLRFLCFRPLAPTAIAVKGIYWHRFVAMVVVERVRGGGESSAVPPPLPNPLPHPLAVKTDLFE